MKKIRGTGEGDREVSSVSFIIPAWNEESVLGPTIDAITDATRQLPVPYEIIVVDDGSTDRTAEVRSGTTPRVVSVQHRQMPPHVMPVRAKREEMSSFSWDATP